MFPGINPRMMKQAMKKMGIKEEALEVSKVIMKLGDGKELVFENPQVSKVDMMGQETYQVVGEPEEREAGEESNETESAEEGSEDTTPEINDDDINTVVDQTGCSKEKAKEVLEETKGDLAEAIIKLKAE